jgi:lactate 2-monooxygenase
VILAPVGVQGILHKDGELATARAAGTVGVPMIMSTASTRSIEAVAKANGDGHRWYQLYWYALTVSQGSRNPYTVL